MVIRRDRHTHLIGRGQLLRHQGLGVTGGDLIGEFGQCRFGQQQLRPGILQTLTRHQRRVMRIQRHIRTSGHQRPQHRGDRGRTVFEQQRDPGVADPAYGPSDRRGPLRQLTVAPAEAITLDRNGIGHRVRARDDVLHQRAATLLAGRRKPRFLILRACGVVRRRRRSRRVGERQGRHPGLAP